MKAEQQELATDERNDRIDAVIEKFEDARSKGPVFVEAYLPSPTDPFHQEIAIELLRVDMQHSWRQQNPKSLATYLQAYPEVLGPPEHLSALAYEDYRMRCLSGQQVSPSEYAEQYAVNIDTWPDLGHSTLADTSPTETTVLLDETREHGETCAGPQRLASLAPGDRIGDFLLLRELGRGAFARVFLARQTELAKRFVVLKISADRKTTCESQYLSRLQHTHIVPIYSAYTHGELHAICMPYFGACTLRDVVSSFHRDPVAVTEKTAEVIGAALRKKREQVCDDLTERTSGECDFHRFQSSTSYVRVCTEIAAEIAKGLRFAHERGFVHRDLKPANVLVADHGTVMLLDFNLSESAESGLNGILGGTLPYLAPEHLDSLLSGKKVDATADIYSLGVVFYELLTGKIPFAAHTTGDSPFVLRQMVAERKQPPPDVRESNAAVPPGLAEIIRRMLAIESKDRYQNASEALEDLQRDLQNRPLVFATNPSRRELVGKWCRRHPKLTSFWTVSVCALLLLSLSTIAYSRQTARLNRVTYKGHIDRVADDLQQIRALVTIPNQEEAVLQDGLDQARESLRWFVPADASTIRKIPNGFDDAQEAATSARLKELLYLASKAASKLSEIRQDASLETESDRYHQLMLTLEPNEKRPTHLGEPNQLSSILETYADPVGPQTACERVEALEAYRESNPHDLSAWILLGNAYVRVDRLRDAEACYSTCAVSWKNSFLPRLLRGNCRAEMREYVDAERDFSFVLESHPHLISARINRAAVRGKLEMHEAALADLDLALELGARQTRIHFMRAESLRALGKPTLAKQAFGEGLRATPTDEKSWIRRGLANVGRNDDQALADFHAALRLNPLSRAARTNAVYVLAERQKKTVDAIQLLDEAIKTTGSARDRAARAIYLARSGDFQQAFADIQLALKSSDHSRLVFQAACVYALATTQNESHGSMALDYLKKSIRQQPLWIFVADGDPDLDAIRDTTEFLAILKRGRHRLQTPPE